MFSSAGTLERLKNLSAPQATVLRDGAQVDVPSEDLAPGDIVVSEKKTKTNKKSKSNNKKTHTKTENKCNRSTRNFFKKILREKRVFSEKQTRINQISTPYTPTSNTIALLIPISPLFPLLLLSLIIFKKKDTRRRRQGACGCASI